jgi:hypothetical protein
MKKNSQEARNPEKYLRYNTQKTTATGTRASEAYLPRYGCSDDFEVGDIVHRVGELVQQAEKQNCCGF